MHGCIFHKTFFLFYFHLFPYFLVLTFLVMCLDMVVHLPILYLIIIFNIFGKIMCQNVLELFNLTVQCTIYCIYIVKEPRIYYYNITNIISLNDCKDYFLLTNRRENANSRYFLYMYFDIILIYPAYIAHISQFIYIIKHLYKDILTKTNKIVF